MADANPPTVAANPPTVEELLALITTLQGQVAALTQANANQGNPRPAGWSMMSVRSRCLLVVWVWLGCGCYLCKGMWIRIQAMVEVKGVPYFRLLGYGSKDGEVRVN